MVTKSVRALGLGTWCHSIFHDRISSIFYARFLTQYTGLIHVRDTSSNTGSSNASRSITS